MYTHNVVDEARRRGEELIEIMKCWRDIEQIRRRMEERRRELGERYDEFFPALLALRYLDPDGSEIQPKPEESAEALALEVASGLAEKLAHAGNGRSRQGSASRRPARRTRLREVPAPRSA